MTLFQDSGHHENDCKFQANVYLWLFHRCSKRPQRYNIHTKTMLSVPALPPRGATSWTPFPAVRVASALAPTCSIRPECARRGSGMTKESSAKGNEKM